MYIGRVQIFQVFHSKQFYSWLGRFIYKLGYSNFESTYKKPPFIKVVIFYDVIFVSNYHGCKGEDNKIYPTLFDKYYSQNCKAIIFIKIINHAKYK